MKRSIRRVRSSCSVVRSRAASRDPPREAPRRSPRGRAGAQSSAVVLIAPRLALRALDHAHVRKLLGCHLDLPFCYSAKPLINQLLTRARAAFERPSRKGARRWRGPDDRPSVRRAQPRPRKKKKSSPLPSPTTSTARRHSRARPASSSSTTSITPRRSSTSRKSSTTTRTATTRSWRSCRSRDIHFERGEYEEASSYYHDFVELHPKPPEGRLRALSQRAVLVQPDARRGARPGPDPRGRRPVQALLERYPNSEMSADAAVPADRVPEPARATRTSRSATTTSQQHAWYAAARRYRQALTDYPDHGDRIRTLAQLGFALANLHQYLEAEGVLRALARARRRGPAAGGRAGRARDARAPAALRPAPARQVVRHQSQRARARPTPSPRPARRGAEAVS